MRSSALVCFTVFCLWSPVRAQQNSSKRVFPTREAAAAGAAAGAPTGQSSVSGTAGNGIDYHGGPVMLGTTNVYFIWYGDWSGTKAAGMPILQNYATFVGGSPYFGINTTYYDGGGNAVSNSVNYAGSTTDSYSGGVNLTDNGVFSVVSSAITTGRLPKDSNGVYFVLTSPDVKETSGFCSSYCGWHTHGSVGGTDIKFSFVGNAATQCLSSCAEQTTSSPNGIPAVDGMASVLGHELEEAVTDPDLNAWYDVNGNENADKCAWTFGQTYSATNGSLANMNLGGYDFLIQRNWVNAGGGSCALKLNSNAPALNSITPSSGTVNTSVNVTLTGTNLSGATLSISGSGVTISNVVTSASQITATFAIASAAAAGGRTVTATTANGTSNGLTFTVNGVAGAPVLSSISPSSGLIGSSVGVTLTGTNLSGATIAVGGSGITVSGVTASATQVTATFVIAGTATSGNHSVSVSTASGTSNSVNFNVTLPPPPTVAGTFTPFRGNLGQNVAVTLSGSNFVAGGTSLNFTIGTGITASNISVANSSTLSATLNIAANASLGDHFATATTAAGTSSTRTYFEVYGVPNITSMTPTSGNPGSTVAVTLNGSSFSSDATVQVSNNGITTSGLSTMKDGTVLQITFTIAAGASGPANVTVSNSVGVSNAVVFTINGGSAPVLSGITPTGGTAGSSVPVTISGSNLSGASLNISGAGVTASNVAASATQITATLTLSSSASGAHTITATTAGGTSNGVSFSVTPAAPVLSGINPTSGTAGSSVPVTISGSNLSGASLNISGAGVTASNVTPSATQMTATLTLSSSASGPYTITATTAGGTSNGVTFSVTPAAPVLSGINPTSGTAGSSVPVTISGSNLSGASLNLSGAGVTASNVTASATLITATLTLSSSASGPYTITATTAGGTSNGVTFSVSTPVGPSLTSIVPASGRVGTNISVTLSGSNLSGATVNVGASGIAVTNVTSAAGQVTATFNIAGTATLGNHSVTVTTANGVSNALNFSVTAPPAPTVAGSFNPISGNLNQNVPVTLSGTNFVPGATAINFTVGTGVTATNITVINATTLTATLVVAANANVGDHFATVTTPGGTSSSRAYFETYGVPSITTITPSSGSAGTNVTVTLNGRNFSSDSVLHISVPGVTASGITITKDGTVLTATFTIAAGTAPGGVNVTVSNSVGTSAPVVFNVQ